jgi:hypothetical protein
MKGGAKELSDEIEAASGSEDFEYAVKNLMVLIAGEGEARASEAVAEAKRRLEEDDEGKNA